MPQGRRRPWQVSRGRYVPSRAQQQRAVSASTAGRRGVGKRWIGTRGARRSRDGRREVRWGVPDAALSLDRLALLERRGDGGRAWAGGAGKGAHETRVAWSVTTWGLRRGHSVWETKPSLERREFMCGVSGTVLAACAVRVCAAADRGARGCASGACGLLPPRSCFLYEYVYLCRTYGALCFWPSLVLGVFHIGYSRPPQRRRRQLPVEHADTVQPKIH